MRILFYNWVDYLDDEARGGGVSVYQRNLIKALDDIGDHEVFFLSAGLSYDLRPRPPRWAPVTHGPRTDRARRFEIVNSGVLAPGHRSFGQAAQLHHAPTRDAFFAFVAAKGPFDVIHFNNLEGVPAEVLALGQRWPETRVILTLHNYYPLCPQVNLWQDETRTCLDFEDGRRCVGCVTGGVGAGASRLASAWSFLLRRAGLRPGGLAYAAAYRPPMRLARAVLGMARRARRRRPERPVADLPGQAAGFAARRRDMIALINRHCDRVLCVSDRVRQIALQHGIAARLLQTRYIGSAHAEKFAETMPRPLPRPGHALFEMGYLGYMRRDKGFFFLLDALEAMPDSMLSRLGLTVAAARGDAATMARLGRLGQRLGRLRHVDGYSADQLDQLLDGIDIGVIPVLWEDNLPQVAIEMHARHIPLLTSDLGGARELSGCDDMVFRAGDVADFHGAIDRLVERGLDVDAYWRKAMTPVSMRDHVLDVLSEYGRDKRVLGKQRLA